MLAYDSMLEKLENPVAKQIKEFRGWQKAVSAAYRPYLDLLDVDGRLRCSYRLHGTATGRLSCADPICSKYPNHPTNHGTEKLKTVLSRTRLGTNQRRLQPTRTTPSHSLRRRRRTQNSIQRGQGHLHRDVKTIRHVTPRNQNTCVLNAIRCR